MPTPEALTRPAQLLVDPDSVVPAASEQVDPGPVHAPNEPVAPAVTIRPETVEMATYEALRRKRKRADEVFITVTGEDGNPEQLKLSLEALDSTTFDSLAEKYKATTAQQAQGQIYDAKRLTPALLELCVVNPKLTVAQWREIIESENWAPGEITHIFNACWRLCNGGLDVSFTVTG